VTKELIDWPTTFSRFLETILFSQLIKKSRAFYGTIRFITVFTRAHRLFISWAIWTQTTPSPYVYFGAFLILSFHLRLDTSSCLFFRSSYRNPVCNVILSNACHIPRPAHPLPLGHRLFVEEYKSALSWLCTFSGFFLLSLGQKKKKKPISPNKSKLHAHRNYKAIISTEGIQPFVSECSVFLFGFKHIKIEIHRIIIIGCETLCLIFRAEGESEAFRG